MKPSVVLSSSTAFFCSRGGEFLYRFEVKKRQTLRRGHSRWISQDPLGFEAGDNNLYRYVNNRPTMATDPSGLQPNRRINTNVIGEWEAERFWGWSHDRFPGKSEKNPEWLAFQKGCIGLCAIRTGSYLQKSEDPVSKAIILPHQMKGVRAFLDLKDALDWQSRAKGDVALGIGGVVLFAIMSEQSHKKDLKLLNEEGRYKSEFDPKSFDMVKAGAFDYNTAFQKKNGTIVFWEHMTGGLLSGKNARILHSKELEKDGKRFASFWVVDSTSSYYPSLIER